jgi:hypothetical protein
MMLASSSPAETIEITWSFVNASAGTPDAVLVALEEAEDVRVLVAEAEASTGAFWSPMIL